MGKSQRPHHPSRLAELLSRVPFLPLPLAFGSFLGFSLPFHWGSIQAFLLVLGASAALGWRFKKVGRKAFFSFLTAFAFSFALYFLLTGLPVLMGEGTVSGVVLERRDNYFLFLSGGRRYLVFERDCLREVGDWLRIEGEGKALQIVHFEGRFSFKELLRSKGVSWELESLHVTEIFRRPLRLREWERAFLPRFEEPARGLLDGLLFGMKDASNEILSSASALGLLSFLGVSGLYFSLYRRFLLWLFGLLPKRKRFVGIYVFFGLLPLFPFGFWKVGVRRVFFLSFLDAFRIYREEERGSWVQLNAMASLLFFALDPFVVLQSGFLYSFGISLFFFLFKDALPPGVSPRKRSLYSSFAMGLFLVPLWAQGGEFFLLAPFAALFLPPFVLPLLFLGYVGFFVAPLIGITQGYASFLGRVLQGLDLRALRLPVYGPFGDFAPLYYGALFMILSLKIHGFGTFARKGSLLLSLAFLVSSLPLRFPSSYSVHFLDVGQGDSILLRHKGKTLLIDSGGTLSFDMGKEVLIPYLRKRNVHRLDAYVSTHEDFDHVGGKEGLLEGFPVGEVLTRESFPYRLGDLSIENLNEERESPNDKNKGSLVLRFELGSLSFLLMGDAPKAVEERIVERFPSLRCDILKAGHHGSKTSSSETFLRAIRPKEAVLSCGEGNRYGHPDAEVLERLKALGIRIRRTDLEGTIVYRGFL